VTGDDSPLTRPFTTPDEFLDPARKVAARQQHTALAGLADQANIGADAHDLPLLAAAWVWFAHLDNVTHEDGRRDFDHG
jgi:hypothetical protein